MNSQSVRASLRLSGLVAFFRNDAYLLAEYRAAFFDSYR